MSSIFVDYNTVAKEIIYKLKKKKTAKNTNVWKLNNMLLDNL